MATAPYWITAGTSIVSAFIGGGIGAWSAHRVMVGSQREERRLRRIDREQEAAGALIDALMSVMSVAFDAAGAQRSSDDAQRAVDELQRVLSSSAPALAGRNMERRLAEALKLIQTRDETSGMVELAEADQTYVLERLHVDRMGYLNWVIGGLQDIAAGDDPPDDVDPPANFEDPSAEAWVAPDPQGLTLAQKTRRLFSRSTGQ